MEQFDERLRDMARREAACTPEGFDGRLREALDGLPPRAKQRRGLGALRGALAAAAACLLLAGTALAASPGLREALAEALGGFAPYAQEQEDKAYVIDGIEFKVKSVLADDFTVRAYVEARDVDGDIFDKIDDLTIPTRVIGGVDVPTVSQWLAADATESWSVLAECLSYDAASRTALLAVSTWKLMPEDFTGAAVEVLAMNSYLTGDYEEVWKNQRGITIPVEVKPVESTVLDQNAALVSGLDAEEARLSPLGLTLTFQDYEVRRTALEGTRIRVALADGTAVEAVQEGRCGVFLPPYDQNSRRVMVWNFQEPVEAEQIQSVTVIDREGGQRTFPVALP